MSWPSSTIEANASLRRLARKDSGASYREYVKELKREAGEDPTDAAAVIRFDKKREKRAFPTRSGKRKPTQTPALPR